jgi:hypothetical protein
MERLLVERKTLLYTIQINTHEQCDINYIHDLFNREYTNIDKKYDLWGASFGDKYKEHTLKLVRDFDFEDNPVVYVYVIYKTEETDAEFEKRKRREEMKDYVSHLAVEQVYKKHPEEFIEFIKKNKLYEKI